MSTGLIREYKSCDRVTNTINGHLLSRCTSGENFKLFKISRLYIARSPGISAQSRHGKGQQNCENIPVM